MVICIIALVVLSVLSTFSATYRPLAKEAFKCVFRTATLRPCESDFDRKVKMFMVMKSAKVSTRLSSFIYKHFKLVSWIFVIIFFLSLYYSVVGLYNLFTIGTCDPNSASCVLRPLVNNTTQNLSNV